MPPYGRVRPVAHRCAPLRRRVQAEAPPHPSSGFRETPDATFPSRGRLGVRPVAHRCAPLRRRVQAGNARGVPKRTCFASEDAALYAL